MKTLVAVLLTIILLTGCSTIDPIFTKTVIEQPTIIHPPSPIPAVLVDFNVIVVNREQLEILLSSNEEVVFFMLDPEGYEIIIKNFNELRRYIGSQKAIILYYREILTTVVEEEE